MRNRTYIRPRNDEFVESDTALCLGASHNMSPLNNRCVVCFSNPQDHSIMRGFMKECAPTLNAAAGMSGNNRPFIVTYGIDQQGGKGGANFTEGVAPTIMSDSHGTPHGIVQVRKKPRNLMVLNFMGSKGNNVVTQDGSYPTIARMHGSDVHRKCARKSTPFRVGGNCAG